MNLFQHIFLWNDELHIALADGFFILGNLDILSLSKLGKDIDNIGLRETLRKPVLLQFISYN